MSNIDNEILLGAQEDAAEVAFIQTFIGPELCEKLTEDDIYYILDVFFEYLEKLESTADSEGYIDINIDEAVKFVVKKAKKEGMPAYEPDDITLVLNAELEYNEQLED